MDSESWLLIFRHDIANGGVWRRGDWRRVNASDTERVRYSRLDELERFRRPSDGRFEFKACWPGSGFGECMHWVQLLQPTANPTLTNLHASCVNCPYSNDEDPDGNPLFMGLQSSVGEQLLDADADGSFLQIGAHSATSGGMLGPQSRNDDGEEEFPTVVELYVRPDTNGEVCMDCRACFDEDGRARTTTYHGGDGSAYEGYACPDYCVEAVGAEGVAELPRSSSNGDLRAAHQLIMASGGLEARPCETVTRYDAIEDATFNTTVCEGSARLTTESVPEAMEFGRIGGVVSRGFFVAPVDGTYTFHGRFDDGGELFLSANADPRSATRLLSVGSGDTVADVGGGSGGAENSGSNSRSGRDEDWCSAWSCVGNRCFRAMGGYLTYKEAKRACAEFDAVLGAPRSTAEQSVLELMLSGQGIDEAWLGISDEGQEDVFAYADGSLAGSGMVARFLCVDETRRCFTISPSKSSFSSADAGCESTGGKFGAPRSTEENDAIKSMLQGIGIDALWIALSDGASEGNFTYVSDGTFAGSNLKTDWVFENFDAAEPNDYGGNEDCVQIKSNGVWNDASCSKSLYSLCEKIEGSIDGFPWIYNNFDAIQPDDGGNAEDCVSTSSAAGWKWNDHECSLSKPFICEAERACDGARSAPPINMSAGEVRFLEFIGYNNGGPAKSLLTLSVDGTQQPSFRTSQVLALSAEFFRKIRNDRPAVKLEVNQIAAACGEMDEESGEACFFKFAASHTPAVAGVVPAESVPGATVLTITGDGFAKQAQLNDVSFGGAACDVVRCNVTFIECVVALDEGTAGTYAPVVSVYNKGLARVETGVKHRILMTIDAVTPTRGSLYGGMTLTLTGSGFARFGPHNQVKLLLGNASSSDAEPRGSHNIYDDDWLWDRGNVGGRNNMTSVSSAEILCVPRTMKNRPCRYTTEDSGIPCGPESGGEWIVSTKEDIVVRERAEWFDFSTTTSIECLVESLASPLPLANSIALINVSVVNETVLTDKEGLDASIAAAKRNFDCTELTHCKTKNRWGEDIDWFGAEYEYSVPGAQAPERFEFLDSQTPVIESVSPKRAMPGELLTIRGRNLMNPMPVEDANWYMSEFGFFYQPYGAAVTVGTYECQIFEQNETVIQCHAVYGEMYKQHKVELSVHGLGNAYSNESFVFALDVRSITPPSGSLAGGTKITIQTSALHDEIADLGVSSYRLWFIPDLRYGMSPHIADYLGITMGNECEVVARERTSTSITCITSELGDSTLIDRPDIWTNPFDVEDAALRSWIVAEWNRNDIYTDDRCDSARCEFNYKAAATPILALNVSQSILTIPNQELGLVKITTGDVLLFKYETNRSAENKSFPWSSVAIEDIDLSICNTSLDFDVNVEKVEEEALVTLRVFVGETVPACEAQRMNLRIEPYGFGVLLGAGEVSVVPAISTITKTSGSIAGGLLLEIEGFGFRHDDDLAVFIGRYECKNVVVTSFADQFSVLPTSLPSGAPTALPTSLPSMKPSAFGEDFLSPSSTTPTALRTEEAENGRPFLHRISCTTPPVLRGSDGDEGLFLNVQVLANGVESSCLEPNTTSILSNETTSTRRGCKFRFSDDHTPAVHDISPRRGYFIRGEDEIVTLVGEGFANKANVVTMGLRRATVISENSTYIVALIPKHVAGTFAVSVLNPNTGLAIGSRLWFRFESGILDVTPKEGSRFGGQTITISGYGFAPRGNKAGGEEARTYLELFHPWTNLGTSNGTTAFDFDTVEATYDTIVGITKFRNYHRSTDSFNFGSDAWIRSLTVDVANFDEGKVSLFSYDWLLGSDGSSDVSRAFDGSISNTYDMHPSGIDSWIMYHSNEPILLTDYQIVWPKANQESPVSERHVSPSSHHLITSSFIHSFIHSFTHSFIHSFMHSSLVGRFTARLMTLRKGSQI